MAENIERLNYQGPPEEWLPVVAGLDDRARPELRAITDEGYYDIGYLLSLLDSLQTEARTMYSECEGILSEYSLEIDTSDVEFVAAHNQVYPSDDTPGYVTFDEYKFLLDHNESTAAQFVIATYETKVRGVSGNNALDISLLALYINSECRRIKEYIDGYIGDIDDSSEFRTIEIFQDWAEDTQAIITELWKALKGQIQASVPRAELDQLTEEKAREFQALFQVKLNVVNKKLVDWFAQLEKTWEKPAEMFYNRNLGPAMKYRLKVGRTITDEVTSTQFPVLYQEAIGTTIGLNTNFENALADCIQRNKIFFDALSSIMLNIAQRDTYITYVNQLSHRGKDVLKPFVASTAVKQADAVVESRILDVSQSVLNSINTFQNLHSDLSGILDDDAHPQYVLRTGNEQYPIVGNVVVADGVTIDGVDIDKHTHDGVNSKKIHGSNIEYGTVVPENLDLSTTATSVPTKLTIDSVLSTPVNQGETQVEAIVSFDIDDTNVTGYEFEILKLD